MHLGLLSRKLSPHYIGPFLIEAQINPVTYRLKLPSHMHISPSFHVSLLKPVIWGPLDKGEADPSALVAVEVEGSPAYRVRSLLDSRKRGGKIQYLVDWEGFGPKEQSWVLGSDILNSKLIREFHRSRPDHPAPRRPGRPCGSRVRRPSSLLLPTGQAPGGGYC